MIRRLTHAAREFASQSRAAIEVARRYRRRHGHFPNLLRPRTFHDKVALRIIFDRRPLLAIAADKLAARRYAEEHLGNSVLPKLYCVTTRPEEIPFDALPRRFVVKPSHASGHVELVTDKDSLDCAALISRCRRWLTMNYYWCNLEWGYKHATPRILVEEFIDDGSGNAPRDYKFFVFDGTIALIQVDESRFLGHRRSLYDRDWNRLEARYAHEPISEEAGRRPTHFEALCAAAETLGRGVDFLRADFYDTEAQLYFGEITMAPGAAMERFSSDELDRQLGAAWKMPPLAKIVFGRA